MLLLKLFGTFLDERQCCKASGDFIYLFIELSVIGKLAVSCASMKH